MRPLLTAILLSLLFSPAGAAEWRDTRTPITDASESANLGFSAKDMAVDAQDRVHLLYQAGSIFGPFQIKYVRRGTDGTWSEAEVLSPAGKTGRDASLAVDKDGRLHAFWEDTSAGASDIVHRQREPDGVWGTPERISPAEGSSRYPVAVVDAGNRVHLVWADDRSGSWQILYSVREAGGTEWSPAVQLSVDGSQPLEPNIAADELGSVYVTWSDIWVTVGPVTSFNVFFLRIGPGPLNDPEPAVLVTSFGGYARRPHLAAMPDGTLHLVWLDNRGANPASFEVFYKRFLPEIGWGKDKRFTYDFMDHAHPVIVGGPENTLNLAWEGYELSPPSIYYSQITVETGWDPEPTRLTEESASSGSPRLAALSTGQLILVWSEFQTSGTRLYAREGHVRQFP